MPKYAVLSMDVEEWFHPDYMLDVPLDRRLSTLDGMDVMRGVLEAHGIRGTFFVVAEIAGRVARKLKDMSAAGHEIACHGLTHVRPLDMDAHTFSDQLRQARTQLEEAVGKPVLGYRAPSFGMDDARFAAVRELGFRYDASGIRSRLNPVYGAFSLDGYQSLLSNLSVRDGFFAFRASTQPFLGRDVPLGGGFFRIFPWAFTQRQLRRYARENDLLMLYVHPSELSSVRVPYHKRIGPRRYLQSMLGRNTERRKLEKTIALLRDEGYTFATCAELCGRAEAGAL